MGTEGKSPLSNGGGSRVIGASPSQAADDDYRTDDEISSTTVKPLARRCYPKTIPASRE